jgi:hypothetical protein
MSDIILPQEEDYCVEIRVAIRETRQAIREALGYIERQEDGPLTMRYALKDIDTNVTAIEYEVGYLTSCRTSKPVCHQHHLDTLKGIEKYYQQTESLVS